ncbi:MAG: DNA polymerase-3 subunit delta [Candidatus Azotimanducaceae bacterium]|jgi:DNA polymerase-3 subunit delta
MKVYPDKLAAHFSKGNSALYIVSGDEPLLVQESCDVVRASLKKKGFVERDLYHVDGSFDWEEVLFSVNSMSLFAEQKLIELRIPKGKPSDVGVNALLEFAESSPKDTCMLLVLPKLDKKVQNAAWFKSLEAKAAYIQIWPIELSNLPRWVNERFAQNGLRAEPDAVTALIDRVEGNLLAAAQEIDRLRLITSDNRVSADLVIDGVSDNARYDVFGLIDAAVGQDVDRTLKVIQGLRAENTELMFLTAMLSKELRTLLSMSQAMREGQGIEAVLQSYRVWAKRKNVVGRCLQKRSFDVLQRCLQWIGKIDQQLKGMQDGNPWDEMERLVLFLAGRRVL